LDEIVFQEKLGSIGNKSRRLEALSRNIAKTLGLPEGPAARAALLCKCDLPSLMVGEFPELQGTMGAYYALASGEPGEVAAAIGSHYQPRYSGDQLPTDAAGRVVSIADRLDTLVGVFAAGQRPTGNRDPFGLRRSALGIIRMLLESGPSLSLSGLVDMAADALGDQLETDAETRAAVLDFMLERLRQWLKDQGYSARQLQAVMTVPDTVSGLWGGYAAANVLKWYWWRLNGMGYFWGMLAGLVGALAFPPLFAGAFEGVVSDVLPLYLFPLLLATSTVACVAASLLSQPEDSETLKQFYRNVRPWGFWGPVHDQVVRDEPAFRGNGNFRRDMFNVMVGIVAQTCLVAAPIYLVVRNNTSLIATLVIFALCAIVLKRTWYDRLDDEPLLQEAPLRAQAG
jgi:hypothetical protein